MATYSVFFLTLTSISAVLLSLCVSLRNAAFSSLVSENAEGVTLGDHDYEKILENAGQRVQYAGFSFLGSAIVSLIGVVWVRVNGSSPSDLTGALYVIVLAFFVTGILLLGWSLTTGYVQVPTPNSSRERTEPQNGDEDR
jgi:hypothetical protein